MEVPEVGVVGGGLAGDASTGTDEAGSNVDGVGVSRLHVDGRESREWTWCWLVVVGCLRSWAAAWVVASEEERTCMFVLVRAILHTDRFDLRRGI